jgi:hypothetical protein
LQRDHQIAPLFLELDQRQTVIRKRFHHGVSQPSVGRPDI